MMKHEATPTKLRSGEWGARITGRTLDIKAGDRIVIRTRGGKSWETTVQTVVWKGPDAAIVATAPRGGGGSANGAASRTRRSSGDKRCRGCRGPVVNARHHRAMNGYCGTCAFDEFDC